MTLCEDLIIEEGRVATLTCDQTWTTYADARQIAGDLLVVVDTRTGEQINAVVYDEDGKRKIGILRQRMVWDVPANPAVDATSSLAFEIPDALPGLAKEIAGVYKRFKK